MFAAKKWLAVVMCVLMVFGQLAFAMAEQETTVPSIEAAVEAGREAVYSGNLQWHSVELIDEETNSLLTSLFGAMEVQGRFGQIDETSAYGEFSLMLSGQEAIPFSFVATDEAAYVQSSMLGSPIIFRYDEMDLLMEKLQAMAETEGGTTMSDEEYAAVMQMYTQIYTEVFAQMDEMMNTVDLENVENMTDEEALEFVAKAYEPLGLDQMMRDVFAWSQNLETVPYEGEVGSMLEADFDSSEITVVNKPQVIELMDIILDDLKGNEKYWGLIYSTMEPAMSLEEGTEMPTLDELMEEVDVQLEDMRASLADMPEDYSFAITESFKDSESVLGQMEMYLPIEDEGDFFFYLEWLTQSLGLYMEAGMDSNGIMLEVYPQDAVDENTPNDGFLAVMTIIEEAEAIGYVFLETNSVTAQTDDGRVWDGGLYVGMIDESNEMGLDFVVHQVDTYEGDDVSKTAAVDVAFVAGGASFPVATINGSIASSDSAGAPFDIETTEFVNPAQMTDEEFTQWQTDVMTSAMQSLFAVMSLLPQDVLAVMFGEAAQ